MTRLFTDGAEGGFIGFTRDSGFTISTTLKRSGNYSYRSGYGNYAYINVLASSELYIRFGYASNVSDNELIVNFTYSGNVVVGFQVYQKTHILKFYVGGTTIAQVPVLPSLNTNQWYLWEIHVKIDNSIGVVELKIDNNLIYSYSGDTLPSSYSTINSVVLGCPWAQYSYLDDIAINNISGVVDNSWCGDGRVLALKPNANGDSSQFTGSDGNSTDNYLLVDDVPHDSDTSYVQANVSGYYDLYNLEACGLTAVDIKRVWVEGIAKDTTTGSGILTPMIKTNSTEVESDPVALSTSYALIKSEEFLVNPVTLSAWTTEDLDNLQAGIKVEN